MTNHIDRAASSNKGQRMKIGYLYWGFLEKDPYHKSMVVNTPDGERGNRVDFVEEMLQRGHEVYALQRRREQEPFPGVIYDDSGFPELDVIFIEWRWKTYRNFGKDAIEPDWQRQCDVLDNYGGKCKIVVLDMELKMTSEDIDRWGKHVVIGDSKLFDRDPSRIYIPLCNNIKQIYEPCSYSYQYGYLGNNYERDTQFKKYYSEPSSMLRRFGYQTSVHGNWLERSPERRDPSMLLSEHHYISFQKRISFSEALKFINSCICVTHITKDEFARIGNVTFRFFESIISGTPALVPVEYKGFEKYSLNGLLAVASPEDVVNCVKMLGKMSQKMRSQIVNDQLAALKEISDYSPAYRVNLIESIAKQ